MILMKCSGPLQIRKSNFLLEFWGLYYKTYYSRNLGDFRNKLVFVSGALALPTNIRLALKSLPGTDNLAYYENM